MTILDEIDEDLGKVDKAELGDWAAKHYNKIREGLKFVEDKRKLQNYIADYVVEEIDRGSIIDGDIIRNAMDAFEGGAADGY